MPAGRIFTDFSFASGIQYFQHFANSLHFSFFQKHRNRYHCERLTPLLIRFTFHTTTVVNQGIFFAKYNPYRLSPTVFYHVFPKNIYFSFSGNRNYFILYSGTHFIKISRSFISSVSAEFSNFFILVASYGLFSIAFR